MIKEMTLEESFEGIKFFFENYESPNIPKEKCLKIDYLKNLIHSDAKSVGTGDVCGTSRLPISNLV